MCDIVALEAVAKCDGNNNTGAMHRDIYIGLASEVDAEPTISGSPTHPEDRIKATAAITMVSGKKFVKVSTESERVKFSQKPIGNRGSRGYEITVEAFIPGLTDKILGFGNNVKNADVLVFVTDPDNGGNAHLIGTKARPAEIMVEYNAGGKTDDEKGGTIKISAKHHSVATYYPISLGIPTT